MLDLRQDTRKFIVQDFLFGEDNGLTDDASFLDLGIMDSTGVLELVAHLEQTYGFKVKDNELVPENLDSINAIAEFIRRKLDPQVAIPETRSGVPA